MAYAFDTLPLTLNDFPYPNMADIWVGTRAIEDGVQRVCRHRHPGWLQSIVSTAESGIYAHSAITTKGSTINTAAITTTTTTTNDSQVITTTTPLKISHLDTSFMQNYIIRQHYPLSMLKTDDDDSGSSNGVVERRLKLVLAVTTWNRLDFLQSFLKSFFDTRSLRYDWVLIVADDGSTDGTIEYLENLRITQGE